VEGEVAAGCRNGQAPFFNFFICKLTLQLRGVKLKNVPKKFEIVIFLKHFLLHF